jgi:16S rRNA (cytosine1402-N4)-methyltransferase
MSGFAHTPVLAAGVIEALAVRPGGRYVDGTVGGGGHAALILEASSPDGWLGACDRDGEAVEAATSRLAPFAGCCEIRRGTFESLGDWNAPGSVDGVLLDLGVSSPQLDNPERGFSFGAGGPLDMRMDDREEQTAAELVNQLAEEDLANLIWEMGGEQKSRRIARAIVREREVHPLETTAQLAGVIERAVPRRGARRHPATKTFQALRIAVNDEAGTLRRGLPVASDLLRSGGRLVTITFHGLEARMIKDFGDAAAKSEVPTLRWARRKSLKPDDEEQRANPRSRSAQLRVLEKI